MRGLATGDCRRTPSRRVDNPHHAAARPARLGLRRRGGPMRHAPKEALATALGGGPRSHLPRRQPAHRKDSGLHEARRAHDREAGAKARGGPGVRQPMDLHGRFPPGGGRRLPRRPTVCHPAQRAGDDRRRRSPRPHLRRATRRAITTHGFQRTGSLQTPRRALQLLFHRPRRAGEALWQTDVQHHYHRLRLLRDHHLQHRPADRRQEGVEAIGLHTAPAGAMGEKTQHLL